jgi:hypothetical protein
MGNLRPGPPRGAITPEPRWPHRRAPHEALRPSFEQPSFQSLRRFRQSHERPLKSLGVTAAQPIVPPPMHGPSASQETLLLCSHRHFSLALSAGLLRGSRPRRSPRAYPNQSFACGLALNAPPCANFCATSASGHRVADTGKRSRPSIGNGNSHRKHKN